LDNAGLSRVYDLAPGIGGGSARPLAGSGVERVVRSSSTHSFEFLINHAAVEREVEIAPDGFDLLTRSHLGDRLVLSPTGVAIIRRGEAPAGG
jgi:hypothetical protein